MGSVPRMLILLLSLVAQCARSEKFECDFGDNCLLSYQCGLTTDSRGGKWSYSSTSSSILGTTGPKRDHSGSGCYAYTKSGFLSPEPVRRLITPAISKSEGHGCARIFYYMYGADVGTLNIYIQETQHDEILIWSKSGNQSESWQKMEQDLLFKNDSLPTVRLIIEVLTLNTSRSDVQGDIAIDDILFTTDSKCDAIPDQSSTVLTAPPAQLQTSEPASSAVPTAKPEAGNYSCTFGTDCLMADYCGLTTPQGSQKWQATAIRTTALASTGPLSDHTTGKGCFVYANSRDRQSGSKYILESPWIETKPDVNVGCVSFYYHMLGNDAGTLRLYLAEKSAADDENNAVKRLIWSRSGNQGSSWNKLEKNWNAAKNSTSFIQVVFEVIMPNKSGSGVNGDVALDDVFVSTSGPCGDPSDYGTDNFATPTLITPLSQQTIAATTTSTSPDSGNYSCTFGTECLMADYCGLTTPQGSQKWQATATRTTALASTGPLSDHTTGKGCFVYANSRDRPSGSKYILESPWIHMEPNVNVGCVRFYYHMLGDDVGTLRLYLAEKSAADDANNAIKRLIWSRSGNQGSTWNKLEKNWNATKNDTSSIQIVFEIVMPNKSGSGVNGDVALDDVFVSTSGPCGDPSDNGTDNFLTSTLRTTLRPQVITSTKSFAPDESTRRNFSCSFGTECLSQGFCGFEAPRESPKWMASAVKVTLLPTGPAGDRTTGKGCFLYANSRNLPLSSKYILNSPWIERTPSSQSGCVSFYYHMSGNDVGTLQVYLTESPNTTARVLVWSRSGDQGSAWNKLEKSLSFSDSNSSAVRLTFEVVMLNVTGSSVVGDVALDDVFVTTTGLCPNPFDNGTDNFLTSTLRTTLRPQVITSMTSVAPDESTRRNFSCSFGTECLSQGFCGFEAPRESPKWMASAVKVTLLPTGPAGDRTTGKGCFLYANSRNLPLSSKYILNSPWIERTPSSQSGCVSFYYHMSGNDVGTLQVYLTESPNATARVLVWSRSGDQGSAWNKLEKSLSFSDSNSSAVRLTFEVVMLNITGSSVAGDVALDDVFVTTTGLCPNPFDNGTDNIATRTSPSFPTAATKVTTSPTASTTKVPGWRRNFTCDLGSDCFSPASACGLSSPSDSPRWSSASILQVPPLRLTGPQSDHSGKGCFIYANSRTARPQSKFVLQTPWIERTPESQVACARFFYHMFGDDIGTLNLHVESASDSIRTPVWSRSGSQGNSWNRLEKNLNLSHLSDTSDIRLVFEVTMLDSAGLNALGDIALDDIYISTIGPCADPEDHGQDNFQIRTTASRPINTPVISAAITIPTTLALEPPENFTCDFGSSCFTNDRWCGFATPSNSPSWKCSTSTTGALLTIGPTGDHTGKGNYVFASPRLSAVPKAKFTLQSPWIPGPSRPSTGCIRLYYHMHGSDVGTLNVYVQESDNSTFLIWTASGDQGSEWTRMERSVEFRSSADIGMYRLVLEAVMTDATGGRAEGVIAIDDVYVSARYKCLSPTADVTNSTRPTTFTTAHTLSSLSPSVTADLWSDKSQKNITCNFGSQCITKNFCDFNLTVGDKSWSCETKRPVALSNMGPTTDNSGKGAFLYADTRNGASRYVLLSPWISVPQGTSRSGCVSLYYYMQGAYVGTLSVGVSLSSASGEMMRLWKAFGNQGTQWQRLERPLHLDSLSGVTNFRVIVEATISNETRKDAAGGIIAIDDVHISAAHPCTSSTDEVVTAKGEIEKSTAAATASLPTSASPMMEDLPKTFTCDFGRACLFNDFCGMSKDSTWITGPLDRFTRHPSLPKNDTTTDGNGCYAHVKLDNQQQSGVHVLLSPLMSVQPSAGLINIRLNYYLSGDESSYMRIYLLNSTSANKILLHSPLGLTNEAWRSVNVSFDTCGKRLDTYKVVVEAVTGAGGKNATRSIVAIDDLRISPSGYCELFVQTTAGSLATSTAEPQCSLNCRNGGTCVGSRCQCPGGYFGDFCSQVEIPVRGRIIIDLDYGLISNTKEVFDAFWNAAQKTIIEMSRGTQSAHHILRNVTVFNITKGSIIVSFTAILMVDTAQLPIPRDLLSDISKSFFGNATELKQTLLKQLRMSAGDNTENITRALESIEQLTILSAALQEDRQMCAPACHETASCRRQVNEYECICKEGLSRSSHDGSCVSSVRLYSEKNLNELEIGLIAGACALLLIVIVMIAVIRRCVSRPDATKKGADSSNGIAATTNAGKSSANSQKTVVEMQTVNNESPVKSVPGNSKNHSLVTNVAPRADTTSSQYVGNGANYSVLTNTSFEKPTTSEPPAQPKQVHPTSNNYTSILVTENSSVEGDNFGSSETICTEL